MILWTLSCGYKKAMNPILKDYARIVPTRKSLVLRRPRDAYRGPHCWLLEKFVDAYPTE
jgi:hypothetical protein